MQTNKQWKAKLELGMRLGILPVCDVLALFPGSLLQNANMAIVELETAW